MNLREQIERGVLTLGELCRLIDDNEKRAKHYRVTLKKWYRKNGALVGQIYFGEILQQEKNYTMQYSPMRDACMHLDFHFFLNIQKKKEDEMYRQRVEEAETEKLREMQEYNNLFPSMMELKTAEGNPEKMWALYQKYPRLNERIPRDTR